MTPTTLFDKIWQRHEVADGLIYIDLHLVHEVTSPQAFDGLRLANRKVRRPDRTLATADHNVPTDDTPVARMIRDELSRKQVEKLEANCREFGVPLYSLGSDRRGIVHVIGPELGVTQPGMTTRTPPRTAPSARSRSASAPPRSSTSWPPRRWCRSDRRRCASTTRASCPRASAPRT